MKYIFSILFCLTLQLGFSQIVKTVGISYTNGTPTYTPAKAGSPIAIDTSTWLRYDWNGSAWIASGMRIQSISGCSAPLYTPSKYQSTIVVNNCTEIQGGPEIYVWNGIAWVKSGGTTYTAGDGIDIIGDVISNTGDLSETNELNTALIVTGGNLRITDPGGNLDVPVSSIAPVQAVSAGTGISISGTTTRTISSTITQGLTTLNSQTGATQTFAAGTTGTDFDISSATNTHTFNLPTASATNRGALTSADWIAFNSKVGGSGTAGYLPKFSASSTISNSGIFDNSGAIGIGTASTSGRVKIVDNGASGNYVTEVHADDQNPWVAAFFNDAYSSSVPGLEYFVFNTGAFAMGTGASGKAFSIYQGYGNNRLTIQSDGNFYFQKNIGALTASPSSAVDMTGITGYTQLRLRTSYTPTSTADALGSTGDTAWDANYFYIKTAAGWKRAALSTF